MGKNSAADGNGAHISAAESDILKTFPRARITWDTGASPYMVSISMEEALVRAFIEPEALAQRGDIYDAFTRRVSELLTDSMTDRPSSGGNGDLRKAGIRAPISAAKARTPRS
jgi:hypothetical protein